MAADKIRDTNKMKLCSHAEHGSKPKLKRKKDIAFFYFAQEVRKKICQENPHISSGELVKLVQAANKKLTNNEKNEEKIHFGKSAKKESLGASLTQHSHDKISISPAHSWKCNEYGNLMNVALQKMTKEQDLLKKQLLCATTKMKALEQSKENENALNTALQEMRKERDSIQN